MLLELKFVKGMLVVVVAEFSVQAGVRNLSDLFSDNSSNDIQIEAVRRYSKGHFGKNPFACRNE